MSMLIRFEDRYGMYTMFRKLHNINIQDLGKYSFIEKFDCFIQFGLSDSGVMKLSYGEINQLKLMGVTEIVFVFDLDCDYKNEDILYTSVLQSRISRLHDIMSRIDYNINLSFIPVVYCAESIILYNFITDGSKVYEIVNKNNTKILCINLLKLLTKINDKRKLKKFDYINYNEFLKKLSNIDFDQFNKYSINLLIHDKFIYLEESEINDLLQEITKHFNYLKTIRITLRYTDSSDNKHTLCISDNSYKEILTNLDVNISD